MGWISVPVGGGVRYGTRLPRCKYCWTIWGLLIIWLIWGWQTALALILVVITICFLIALPIVLIQMAWQHLTMKTTPPFSAMPETTGNIVPFIKATREERERVMQIQRHRCANPYCNTDLRHSVPHWDHIVPRSQGGTDSVHNMQWLCDTCNLNKKDKHWLEFLYHYALEMGQDPNVNEKPWKQWVLTRTKNGLHCQG